MNSFPNMSENLVAEEMIQFESNLRREVFFQKSKKELDDSEFQFHGIDVNFFSVSPFDRDALKISQDESVCYMGLIAKYSYKQRNQWRHRTILINNHRGSGVVCRYQIKNEEEQKAMEAKLGNYATVLGNEIYYNWKNMKKMVKEIQDRAQRKNSYGFFLWMSDTGKQQFIEAQNAQDIANFLGTTEGSLRMIEIQNKKGKDKLRKLTKEEVSLFWKDGKFVTSAVSLSEWIEHEKAEENQLEKFLQGA